MKEALESHAAGAATGLPLPPLHGRRIVALGGGTGLSTLLRGLRPLCFAAGAELSEKRCEALTAIVTVADDGGSSGRLRRAYPILAPGDIRNCLLALAGSDEPLRSLFGFRFNGALDEHSLGNLIITALAELECDFPRAVELAGRLLKIHGRVLPATGDQVRLRAEFEDGRVVTGESSIPRAGGRIRRLSLVPRDVRLLPWAREAIANADAVIIGPGSLYTSLLPNLLVPGLVEAIVESRTRVILVMNLMTEPGETDGYDPGDFLRAIKDHVPGLPVHHLLLNRAPVGEAARRRYAGEGAVPVAADPRTLAGLDCDVRTHDLMNDNGKVRHDPDKLGRAVLELLRPGGRR